MSMQSAVELKLSQPRTLSEQVAQLAELMERYPCYAFVSNEEQTAARALFRGRWTYEAVSRYLTAEPTMVMMNDERASGFMRFRLYGMDNGCPTCLAEIEVYFARGEGRTSFWCQTDEIAGTLTLAA